MCSPTILHLNKKACVLNMYKHFHSSFHTGFTNCWINCFGHENHQLFLKWSSCLTKDAEEVQCHWISHECLLCFSCKLCQTKSVSGVYFTFKWKDQFLGGKLYFAHYSLKLYLFYFIFAAEVLWQNSFFSLQSQFAKRALKMLLIFLSEDSAISSMFSLSIFCQLCKFL